MTRKNISLLLIAASFFGWGMLRALNDILVAVLQLQNARNDFRAMQVHFSFFAAYLLLPLPASWLIQRFGLKAGLAGSAVVMGVASPCCATALHSGLWLFYFPSLFAIAAGIAILQTAGNPAITRLGSAGTASRRLLALQSASSLGSAIAPFLLAGHHAFALHAGPLTPSVAVIYFSAGLLMLLVGVAFLRDSQPILTTPAQLGLNLAAPFRPPSSLISAMLSIFLFVGAEATLLSHVLPYRRSYAGSGSAWVWAATLATYWILVTAGRWLAFRALQSVDLILLLRIAAGGGAALVAFAAAVQSSPGTFALLLTGLFNAAIFPVIFSLCVQGLDLRTLAITSGFLMTAICGGAIIPLCSGLLADAFGLRFSFLLPILCYLWIAFTAPACRSKRAA